MSILHSLLSVLRKSAIHLIGFTALFSIFLAVGFATHAEALPIQYNFSGTITNVTASGTDGTAQSQIAASGITANSSTFEGVVIANSITDVWYSGTDYTMYNVDLFKVTIDNNMVFQTTAAGVGAFVNSFNNRDQLVVTAKYNNAFPIVTDRNSLRFDLIDSTNQALANTDFPTNFSLGDFAYNDFSVSGWSHPSGLHRYNIGGRITSFTITGATVPEPTTMLLLGTGLIGFAGIRRKMKNF